LKEGKHTDQQVTWNRSCNWERIERKDSDGFRHMSYGEAAATGKELKVGKN
jgi:hypothetical protein